jgi:predicted transcriptional regulator
MNKEQIVKAMQNLPEDATLVDAMDALVFLMKIQQGLAEADAGLGIPQEEVQKRLAKWLT